MKICFLAVGSELLKGRIINTNITRAGEILRSHGYDLSRGLTIQDSREAIWQALETELAENDIVIMSGGLGPTTDDITKKTIADFFGVEMVEHAPTVAMLEAFFQQRNIPLSDRNRAQALVPTNCEVMLNKRGTAPGMCFRIAEKLLFSLPGVPFEMLYLLEKEILPILQKSYPTQYFLNHILRLWSIPESSLADKIATIEANFPPNLDLSYLPRIDGIWLETTLRGQLSEKDEMQKDLEKAIAAIKNLVPEKIYTEGKKSLEEEILAICTEKKLTLAIAESMTGGHIAAKLVTISGASTYFKGSVTAYYTEIKVNVLEVPAALIEKHTVVSAEVAMKMAEGVRKLFGADIGLATTGYAEKSGEILPNVWTGYADAQGTDCRNDGYFNERIINIERATSGALIFLLRKLKSGSF